MADDVTVEELEEAMQRLLGVRQTQFQQLRDRLDREEMALYTTELEAQERMIR